MNGKLSAAGFGTRNISVSRIAHGVEVRPGGEDALRHNRVLYTKFVTGDSFQLVVNFPTRQAYESLAEWLEDYGERVSDPDRGVTLMRVEVPSRRFDRQGVVTRGVTFGDGVDRVVYSMTLQFLGVAESLKTWSPRVSRFRGPVRPGDAPSFASPEMVPIHAAQTVEQRLYGDSQQVV